MASKRQDSTTSSEEGGEEHALFTRKVEIVEKEKAKRGLFEDQPNEEQPARPTRAARPPVRGDVSSSTSSYVDDSDQDKTVDPDQLSEDSSDRKSRRLEAKRELQKKKQLEKKKKKQPELKKKEPGFPSGK